MVPEKQRAFCGWLNKLPFEFPPTHRYTPHPYTATLPVSISTLKQNTLLRKKAKREEGAHQVRRAQTCWSQCSMSLQDTDLQTDAFMLQLQPCKTCHGRGCPRPKPCATALEPSLSVCQPGTNPQTLPRVHIAEMLSPHLDPPGLGHHTLCSMPAYSQDPALALLEWNTLVSFPSL